MAEEDEEEGVSNSVLVAAGVCSLVVGALAAYAFMNLGTVVSAVAFVLAVAGTVYYLSRKEFVGDIVGSSSYVAGGLLVLAPSILYLSNVFVGGQEILLFPEEVELEEIDSVGEMLFGAGGPDVNAALSGEITAVMPLVAWTVAYMLVALVLFVAGALLRSRASKERRWKEQRERD